MIEPAPSRRNRPRQYACRCKVRHNGCERRDNLPRVLFVHPRQRSIDCASHSSYAPNRRVSHEAQRIFVSGEFDLRGSQAHPEPAGLIAREWHLIEREPRFR